MTNSNVSSSETDREADDVTASFSRRTLLRSGAATGALLLGAGTVSANGQGGAAIVRKEDYKTKPFVITEVTDPFEREKVPCGGGDLVSLVGWHFSYEDEDEVRTLYTRDNKVKTGVTYTWPGNDKSCGDFIQTGYSAGGNK
ncbi:hypothetical protein ACH9L7_00945 [Haloferax sp. S1W]|uniref:hypothetical protein n=1 Tax=Haloferax sp. S1W TaxID=3377110 RepID=UPI0037C83AAE